MGSRCVVEPEDIADGPGTSRRVVPMKPSAIRTGRRSGGVVNCQGGRLPYFAGVRSQGTMTIFSIRSIWRVEQASLELRFRAREIRPGSYLCLIAPKAPSHQDSASSTPPPPSPVPPDLPGKHLSPAQSSSPTHPHCLDPAYI